VRPGSRTLFKRDGVRRVQQRLGLCLGQSVAGSRGGRLHTLTFAGATRLVYRRLRGLRANGAHGRVNRRRLQVGAGELGAIAAR
jgi:hypothetical protein